MSSDNRCFDVVGPIDALMSSGQSLGHEFDRGLGIGGKNQLIGELFEHSRLGSLELGVEMARKLDTT